MQIVLVVNPFASNVSEERLERVQEELARAGTVDTLLTEAREDATRLARGAEGADALVVYGGDGAVNEALNGLPPGLRFGALPGGGTSVFSRALGLPRDAAAAAAVVAERIADGSTRRITLGRVDGRRFAFSAGIGIDAATVRRVDALGRASDGRRPGNVAFAYELMRVLAADRFHVEPALEIAGLGRAAAVLVANGDPYTYAGPVPLHFSPAARFELGLDLIAPVRIRRRRLARLVWEVVRGHGFEAERDVIYAHDVDRIEVTCERPLPLHADGEDLGDVEHAVFEAERAAVDVLV